mgnify:CR=1 FL=1
MLGPLIHIKKNDINPTANNWIIARLISFKVEQNDDEIE